MTRLRRILHPTDFSSASSGAYRQAVELARSPRRLVLARTRVALGFGLRSGLSRESR